MVSYPQLGETFGPYRIVDQLGRGGMGVVFRAVQTTLNRQVALKVLLPHHADVQEFRERFTREASALAAMDSPHIIAIHDFGEANGCLFIATQLVPGGDLAGRLAAGPFPLPLALTVTEQLASALSAAHQAGVIHRDVKPTNVLLGGSDTEPYAYLCDFGIARTSGDHFTQTGTVVGTYAYMAPERIDGGEVSPASDIYALGCLLVATVTGHAPYQGTDMQVAQQHIRAPIPQWEPTTPTLVALNRIVSRAMAKDPAARYASAQEMRQDVLAAASGNSAGVPRSPASLPPADANVTTARGSRPDSHPTPAEPLGDLTSPRRRSSSWTWAAALVAAGALIAAVAVAAVLLLHRSPDSTTTADGSADKTPAAPARKSAGTTEATDKATASASEAASGSYTCLDGRTVAAKRSCDEPEGQAGLQAVFPQAPPLSRCFHHKASQLFSWQRGAFETYRHCDEALTSGHTVRVLYVRYRSRAAEMTYLHNLFDADPYPISGGLLEYPIRTIGSHGGYEVARTYNDAEGHPFSASVACGRPAKCRAVMPMIQFRPANQFD